MCPKRTKGSNRAPGILFILGALWVFADLSFLGISAGKQVLDEETNYGSLRCRSFFSDRFAETANQKGQVPFTVIAFSSLERLEKFSVEQDIELLLMDVRMKEAAGKIKAEQVVFFRTVKQKRRIKKKKIPMFISTSLPQILSGR